jgi:stage III sporulation protein AD
MDTFFRLVGGVLIAVVLGVTLSRQSQDITLVLSVGVCCMVVMAAAVFLTPVMDLIRRLQQLAQLEEGALNTVLKAVGIGLVGEIAALVCGDAGNAALSKAVQIATASAVLWLSVPLMEELLVLIREVLELT